MLGAYLLAIAAVALDRWRHRKVLRLLPTGLAVVAIYGWFTAALSYLGWTPDDPIALGVTVIMLLFGFFGFYTMLGLLVASSVPWVRARFGDSPTP